MNYTLAYLKRLSQIPLSMLMLVVYIFFTVCIFLAPYTGFYFNPSTGEIIQVYDPNNSLLQEEDILSSVGDISFEQYKNDSTQPLFKNKLNAGDNVLITVLRNNVETIVHWTMPGFNTVEFRGRLFNIWWLAYIFWLFGTAIEAFIRPHETKWWLLLLANHLTGLWILLGSFSAWHLLGGSIFFHAVTWLLLPIYLHLNWIFPKPLFWFNTKKSSFILYTLYVTSIVLFFTEIIQFFPQGTYLNAIVITFLGSIVLQLFHFFLQPEQRKQIKLIFFAAVFAGIPIISLSVVSFISNEVSSAGSLALIALLFVPTIYSYLILQKQLGEVETKTNLFISSFAFLILVGTLLIITIYSSALLPIEISAFLDFVIPLLTAVLSIRYFPKFQKSVEKNILGISIDYEKLQESFSNLIITNTTMESLLRMLEKDVFPSLLIRQYAFVQVENHHLHPLLMKGVTQAQLPEKEAISKLHQIAGRFIPNLPPTDDWLRLVLPLKVGDSTLGFFLLGSRDPDDIYHQQEIPSMQSIANQTSVALSNILRAETLREMHERGIHRYEQERLRLSHELHDSVLHELSELRKHLEQVSPKVDETYEIIKDRLREVINDLRPPALDNGLTYALKTLAENLMQKSNDTLKVKVNLHASEERLAEDIELYLFRIVEESCNNTLKHAQAKLIKIEGSISPQQVDLSITDDGVGFEINEKWNLQTLLANRHFGLVGMFERTHLIGATLNLQSLPKQGTRVQVLWSGK